MASYIDAANGLADLIAEILVPDANGRVALVDAIVKIYVGWPNKQDLDTDLAAGTVHISVFPTKLEKVTSVTPADMNWIEDSATRASRETQRRTRQMQIGIWASTPAARDAIGDLIEAQLSDTFRTVLSDGTSAILSWTGGQLIDDRQVVNLYRRDVMVAINYGVIRTMAATPISRINIDVTAQNGAADIGTFTISTPKT